jgi:integrase/recombinase XerD
MSDSTAVLVRTQEDPFTDPERLALAGFLAGYSGLTRDAYAHDLRVYSTWVTDFDL